MSSVVVTERSIVVTLVFENPITMIQYIKTSTDQFSNVTFNLSSSLNFTWQLFAAGATQPLKESGTGTVESASFSPFTLVYNLAKTINISAGDRLVISYTGDPGTNFSSLVTFPFSPSDIVFDRNNGFPNPTPGSMLFDSYVRTCLGIPTLTPNYLDSVTLLTGESQYNGQEVKTRFANGTATLTTTTGATINVNAVTATVSGMRQYQLKNGNSNASDPYYARVSSFRYILGGQKHVDLVTGELYNDTVYYLVANEPRYFYHVPWGTGVTLVVLGRNHSFAQAVVNRLQCSGGIASPP